MSELSRFSHPHPREDLSQQLSRYARAVWRRRLLVLIVAPAAALAATWLMLNRGAVRPKLESRVVMGLESPGQWGALDEYADIGAYRVELIRSRRFLQEVAANLSLRLSVDRYHRAALFDSVALDSSAVSGIYRLKLTKKRKAPPAYTLYFTNRKRGYNHKPVLKGTLADRRIALPGATLWLSDSLLGSPHDFRFKIVPLDRAVENIVTNLTVDPPTRMEPDHFAVTLAGRDYKLVAATLNAIAEAFVERNISLRKSRTRERLEVLETQLESAEEQLKESESALKRFLSDHPSASLEGRIASMVTNMAGVQSDRESIARDLREIDRLTAEFRRADGETLHLRIGEILAFLDTKGVTVAQILRVELSALLSSRTEMERNYMEGHPLLVENMRRIRAVGARGYTSLRELRGSLEKQYRRSDEILSELSTNLQNLPAQTLRLAELQRDQQIRSQLYTSLQNRYNEARVADAVSMADVFIIDRAAQPTPPPLPLRLLRLLAVVLSVGIAAGLAPVLLMEHLDKTALTEFEVSRITDLPVVESIPVIKPSKSGRMPTGRPHVTN